MPEQMSSGTWPLGEEGTSLVRVLRDENDVFKSLPAARVCSAAAKMVINTITNMIAVVAAAAAAARRFFFIISIIIITIVIM